MTPAERQRRFRYASHASLAEMDAAIAREEAEERAAEWVKLRERGYQPCPCCGEPVAIEADAHGKLGLISQHPPSQVIHRRSVRELRRAGGFKYNKDGTPSMKLIAARDQYFKEHPNRVLGPGWRDKLQREHEKNIVTRLPVTKN